jgi:SAM-dependent methyltransferase
MNDVRGHAISFGIVADSYDRVRPGPTPEALDWLVPAGVGVAVDLAAGTGLFTRALAGRAGELIAVEPDERMRDVLAARSPEVRVLAGRAEAIPLPDASADAVFVSTAWHWFDPELAVREITRVLRDGGRLGVVWTSRDREADWVAELDIIRSPDVPRTVDEIREKLSREHSVTLPEGAELGAGQQASFGFTRIITIEDTLDWLGTASQVIAAAPADREAGLTRARAVLLDRFGAAALVKMPMRSWCWRADRLPRSRPLALVKETKRPAA